MRSVSKRILCAVDFSEASREALHVAIDRARQEPATLLLLHVQEHPLWVNEPALHLPGDTRKQQLEANEAELEAWRQEALRRGVPEVTARLVNGVAWDAIVAAAREDPTIGLVVVATHGRTGLAHALIGSVAERVVRHAPCSVLVVRAA